MRRLNVALQLQFLRPSLATVKHRNQLESFSPNTIRNYVWRAGYDEFASTG